MNTIWRDKKKTKVSKYNKCTLMHQNLGPLKYIKCEKRALTTVDISLKNIRKLWWFRCHKRITNEQNTR